MVGKNKNWGMIATAFKKILSTFGLLLFAMGCSSTGHVPHKSEDYDAQRRALLEQDAAQRFSSDIELNAAEQSLNDKLLALRLRMKAQYDSIGFFPPSQPFLKYKGHVETTALFQLLRNMPKGGIHHLHPSAAVDFKWLVTTLGTYPNAYVYWDSPDNDYIKGEIGFFSEKNVPEGFTAARTLQESDSTFKDELFELLTFSKEPTLDSLDIWIEFEKVFQRINKAFAYKPLFEPYMRNVAENLVDDGIMHMESRTIFNPKYEFDALGNKIVHPVDTTVQILKRIENEIRRKHPGFTHKVIYTSLRFFSADRIAKEFVKAFQYRKRYPELIKGFDLVAEEDNGNTTYHFKNCWAMRDSLENSYGIDMPLCLHDGESNSPSVKNMYDALLLNSKRIGHGFNIMNFPVLVEVAKEKDVCIEISPLSNQILGYVKDLRLHPASLMLRHGVQCSISSDDPSIFKYQGLSYDYWYAIMAWELDLRDIKKLVFNSITYSSLNPKEKEEALNRLHERWTDFIAYGNNLL